MEQLLKGIDNRQYSETRVFGGNQGTKALARNPVNRQSCKHIDMKYHFIREAVNSGRVVLEYCPTEQILADVMTKTETKLKLKKFAWACLAHKSGKFCFYSNIVIYKVLVN